MAYIYSRAKAIRDLASGYCVTFCNIFRFYNIHNKQAFLF